jgi:hypothetical protein
MKLRAQLAYYDIAGAHEFTAEFLDSPALAGAVAAVAGASARFFVCHDILQNPRKQHQGAKLFPFATPGFSLRFPGTLPDIFHAHRRERLPVSLPFPVILAAFVLEDYDLRQPPMLNYRGPDRDSFHERLSDLNLLSVGKKEHLAKDDVFPDFAGDLLHSYHMPRPCFVLASTGPENRVHDLNPPTGLLPILLSEYKTPG